MFHGYAATPCQFVWGPSYYLRRSPCSQNCALHSLTRTRYLNEWLAHSCPHVGSQSRVFSSFALSQKTSQLSSCLITTPSGWGIPGYRDNQCPRSSFVLLCFPRVQSPRNSNLRQGFPRFPGMSVAFVEDREADRHCKPKIKSSAPRNSFAPLLHVFATVLYHSVAVTFQFACQHAGHIFCTFRSAASAAHLKCSHHDYPPETALWPKLSCLEYSLH